MCGVHMEEEVCVKGRQGRRLISSHCPTSSLTAERRSIRCRQRDALSSVTGSTRIPDNPERTET